MSWNLDRWILEVQLPNKQTYGKTYRAIFGQGPKPLPENDGMRIQGEARGMRVDFGLLFSWHRASYVIIYCDRFEGVVWIDIASLSTLR